MAEKPQRTFMGTMRKIFSKTDIPPKVTTAPGHTVRTKNVVYMSGPSTWKNRVKAGTGSASNSVLAVSPPPPPAPPSSSLLNGNGHSHLENGSTLIVANGTMQIHGNGNASSDFGGSMVSANSGVRSKAAGNVRVAGTQSTVQFSTLPPVIRAQQQQQYMGNGGAQTVQQGGNNYVPQTLPKPANKQTDSKADKKKNRETFRNYVYINEYDDADNNNSPVSPSHSSGVSSSNTPTSPTMQLHFTSPYNLGAPQQQQRSPFAFAVTDATNVTASGDGLGLVPCGKPTSFTVLAPGGRMQDIKVKILGPDGREVYPRLHDNGSGNFLVDWTPRIPGDHKVDVRYRDQPIPGSVFTAKAWDATAVIVSNIRPGRMGKPNYFNVDASRAGAGNLELIVSVSGDNVPNFVKAEGNARFEVSFTPHTADTHMISVKFNGEIVPGSPFYASVVDGSKATASGDGLKNALVGRPAPIVVVTQHVGGEGVERANCVITVTGPSGRQVPVRVTGSPHAGFDAEYTPVEVGRHTVKILYADVDVQGSPFTVNVHDSGNVRVGNIPDGVLNKPVIFEVDASSAGDGTLSVDVQAATSKPYPEVMPLGGGKYQVSFVPHEASPHAISVLFAGAPVTGSPFTCMVYDAASALQVQWGDDGGSGSLVPVRRPVYVTINPKRLPQQPITAQVQDPFNRSMHARVERLPDGIQRIEFTPTEVGGHVVSILYGGQPVPGSPHTSTAYDASRLRIVDVTQDGGAVGQDHGFTVDTTDAGPGEISVEVTNSLGQSVPTTRRQLDTFHQRHTFLPTQHGEHNVHVLFNGDTVPGSPLAMEVANPLRSLSVNGSSHLGIVDQLSHMTISTRGSSSQIDPKLLAVTVSAPNNDLVPAKIVQQPDGDYKVEYSSMYTGRHTVEILYSGQPIMGSPFFVEIYDPNKIRVEGSRSGTVAQMMDFEIIRNEAGKAELGLNITSPSGMPVQYNIVPTRLGDRVTYTPNEPGPYQIYITYGGLEVPGCPITQTIVDSGSMANAYGDGLYKGYEDVPSSFVVDTRNQRGDLTVEVEGPNSMAKCHRQSNGQGQDTVTFTPVEVGEFLVHVKWNGRHIEGSPFRPKVVDPRKLRVIGGWENIVDVNSTFLQLNVNQPKRIEFDSSLAGPGVLSAEARGPDGVLPTQVERLGTSHILTFTPRVAGEHTLALYWSDSPVPRSPLMGVAGGAGGKMNGSLGPVNHEKVVLTGRGLKEASVRQEAEFVIDGMEAGPGAPDVKLTGIKTDIHVQVTPLGEQKYRCVYEPQLPGAYLLNIMWSDRQVRGSPFKVNVIAHSDASKVVCTGDGLKTGILGREIKSLIDTRQAGPGELTAHCMGPGKVAFCELYDHRNGTFQLNVRPQEAGRHVLQIKYGGEHVPGSPYVLKVSGAPDASKVRVSGPGIEHGILATYQSRFICETRGAGAGQLTVRIRGPKGAFRVEMQRESQKDRTILCRYDPTEVGDYIISVKWSGVDVPGSPFHIQIFDTTEELERFMADNPGRRQNAIDFPPRSNGGWAEDL